MKNLKKEQGEQKVQKLRHKLVIIGIIICFAFISPMPYCEGVIPVVQDAPQNELVENSGNVADLDIDPINTDKVKKNVVPDTKNELKKVIGLFIKTMISVAFCAVLVYIILLFVKKYYGSAFAPPAEDEDYDNLELTTPDDKTDALKSFLNRTK